MWVRQSGGEGDPDIEATSALVWCRPDVDEQIQRRCLTDRGMERRRDCASPQQLDGISNIRSWNVRNAGQSDLTEKEGGEDRQVRKDIKKKRRRKRRGDMGKSGTAKELGAQHCLSL